MAALVSHAMHRFPTSPLDAVHSSYGLRSEGSNRVGGAGGDVPARSSPTTGALSRSMRYAEPWLYGTVRASGGLLLAPALVLCQCPDYLTGSKRSSSKKSPYMCKKCKGTRLPLSPGDSKFGTVRCYSTSQQMVPSTPVRAGTVRATSSVRPSILPTADPYDLMRRSRLSVPETTSSVSPFREKTKSASHKKYSNGKVTFGRKSILECDINPYELMANEKQVEASKSKNVDSDQRIKLRKGADAQLEYEDVQVPKNCSRHTTKVSAKQASQTKPSKTSKKHSPVRLISTPTTPDKEPDYSYNALTASRFKSILKKRGSNYNGDSSPYSDVEEAVSPSSTRKAGSKFYIPVPLPLTPRKKVQFVDPGKNDSSEEDDKAPILKVVDVVDVEEDRAEVELLGSFTKTNEDNEDEDEVFEDALENIETNNNTNKEEDELLIEHQEKRPTVSSNGEDKKAPKIYRSNSDCVSDTLRNVNFYDTMALRSRKRSDSRIVFSDKDLAKLDGIVPKKRQPSPAKQRPNTPPPLPPTVALMKTEDENPVDVHKLPTEVVNSHKISISGSVEGPSDNFAKIEANIESSVPPSAPPRKRSNNKQPSINIVTFSEGPLASVTLESPTVNKTIVEIKQPTPVHRIKIKNEFPEYSDMSCSENISIFDNHQRKTSILISGNDCYSTVINDNVPLYQSSVVVNDDCLPVQINTTNNSSRIYITGTFISGVESSQNTTKEEKSQQNLGHISETNKQYQSTPVDLHSVSSSELLKELLRDPVEAVRHNLVPHVCGKSDVARRQRDLKFPKHTSSLGKAESLLEYPLEDTNIPTSVEDSFLRLRKYESVEYDAASEDGGSSQYELMDQSSECYTDHSNRSSVTEEELVNRTKFYELLAETGNIEVSEGDDHHYESIKVSNGNSDPIYEEIEMPPPLPTNPPPSLILDDLHIDKEYTTRSIFEGASKYDILSYLVDAKERGIEQEEGYTYHYPSNSSPDDETKEPYNRMSHMSTVSDSSEDNSLIISDDKATFQKAAEVERNDSGVGSETSKSSLSKYRIKPEVFASCEDCDSSLDSKAENEPLLCRKCIKKRSERKEIITEIVETEEKYSRDLQIILEEFYQPMLVAGLLTPDQLSAIFLNTEELLENSQALAERLRDAVEIALEQGDDDLLTVNIGKLFLEAAPMLHAFETYCIRQGNASLLLASLEKDKELLRIFLRVSQMENTMLRRMNLNSFLMVPVQRVTKYPLLLARLYKVTPTHHDTREQLRESQHKIELHLNHMNSETKDVPSKLWRRIGSNPARRSSAEMDLVNIKLRKIAVDVLEWNHEEARFVLEGKLLFTQPTDNNWRKGRTIKLTPVNALLVINGKTQAKAPSEKTEENSLVFSARNSGVREAALLLVRDKNGRYSLLRDPLYLDRCVIAADPAWQSYFEVQELLNKDTFIFKAEDEDQTHLWYRKLQYHAQGMGTWRKRRNALANIMINGMGLRS
ncbi:uncharacterized protein RhoGEF64C [Euwallacea fornicatus]|uniref:uncharacterized protein RhoGEF64C n=1 Tax=Euwallacea fornicatus TaxID=995702 RepID=UPI00338E0225